MKTLGFINRSCYSLNSPSVIQILYFSLIRPQLVYSGLIWTTLNTKRNSDFEKIQNNFFHHSPFKFNLNRTTRGFYVPVINYLNLNALNDRKIDYSTNT